LTENKEASISFVGRQLRKSSRFAPAGDSYSNSSNSEGEEDNSERLKRFVVESVESPHIRQNQEMDLLTNKLIGEIDYDFDPTKLMYIMTSEEETKERK